MKMKFNTIISLLICLNFLAFTISETATKSTTKNTLPGRNKKEFPESSPLKDGKKGSFYELANHPIVCADPSSALQGFQLWGKFGFVSNSIAYQWACRKLRVTPGAKPTSGKYDKVKIKVIAANPVQTLEKLKFKCEKGSVIKGMVMERKGDIVNSKTTCIKAQIKECQKEDLSFKNINFGFVGKSAVSQLGQFKIHLKPWQVLREVKGDFEKGDFRYRIKWCNIGNKSAAAYGRETMEGQPKMKVLHTDPKNTKIGNDFCSTKCKTDLKEKSKKCLLKGVTECSVCESNLPITDPKYKASNKICHTYCNIYKNTNFCRFMEFEFIVTKKRIPTAYLKTFNMDMIAHRNIK